MNPYEPPTASCEFDAKSAQSHPAKSLLCITGALGLFQGVIAIPVGLFVGPHILGAAVAMLGFGSAALWLGIRRYDRFSRGATITCGVLAFILILVATTLQPPSMHDVAGIVFISLLLLMACTITCVGLTHRTQTHHTEADVR